MNHHPLDYAILVLSLICLLLAVPLAAEMVSACESLDSAQGTLTCASAVEGSTPLSHGAELDPGEDPQEDAQIEASLVEAGYFRDDIPLSCELQDVLQTACTEFDIPFELMLALIERESQFTWVDGDGGESVGYCQIQPQWWQWMADLIGSDLYEPAGNLRTGCAVLAYLVERYGDMEDALTAYNTGSPGVSEYAAAVLERTREYEL